MKRLPVHPACAALPEMAKPELDALADDIRRNGLLDPILTWRSPEGTEYVVDGRSRQEACYMAGVAGRFQEWQGNLCDLVPMILSRNVHRRHLTTSQRAAVATDLLPWMAKGSAVRETAGKPDPSANLRSTGKAAASAAAAVKVSTRSVETASRVREAAPDLHEKVKAGELSLHKAEAQVKRREEAKPEPAKPVDKDLTPRQRMAAEAMETLEEGRRGFGRIQTLGRQVAALRKEIGDAMRELPGHARFIDQSAIVNDFEHLLETLRAGKPHWSCPYCKGSRSQRAKCRPCQGAGWVPKAVWDQADPDAKMAMPIQPAD